MACALLLVLFAAAEPGDECLPLNARFDTDGFASETGVRDGDFDGEGNAFSVHGIESVPFSSSCFRVRSFRFGTVEFLRPPFEGKKPNMVSCRGQEIPIQTKEMFNVLFALGSSHHGVSFGWIEFRFEDGTTGLGPFGASDWAHGPLLGEETAAVLIDFKTSSTRSLNRPLWLQRTPIPAEKRIVGIRLPDIPNAKIVGLTLGRRDGVRPMGPPAAPKPDPGPVAIFCETNFPYFQVRADLTPERIRAAFTRARIHAALLGVDHLKDPALLNVKAYPVLIEPYGNTFPADAERSLRDYRGAGGSMVHLGVPFTHPVVRTPYGNFIDLGHTGEVATSEGQRAMAVGCFDWGPFGDLAAGPELVAWGLGDVPWPRFLPRGGDRQPHPAWSPQVLDPKTLHSGDEVIPLLSLAGAPGPFSALIRHRGCGYDGCIDLWGGAISFGFEPQDAPIALTVEMIVRGAARILAEKKVIDDAAWKAIARPPSEPFRAPEPIPPILPDPAWGWRLPKAARTGAEIRLSSGLQGMPDAERILLVSAQGLINRAAGPISVYLEAWAGWKPDRYLADGLISKCTNATRKEILDLVGHRKAVVVDPDVRGSLNLATMIAAADGLLIAYPAVVEPYRLEIVQDLRGRFASGAEGYAWAWENLRHHLRPRVLAMVEPTPATHGIRDYLIAEKVFTFWISGERDQASPGACLHAEHAIASKVLAETAVCIPVLGPAAEALGRPGVELASRFGKYLVEATWIESLSFQSGLPARPAPPTRSPAVVKDPVREKVHLSPVQVGVYFGAPWWHPTKSASGRTDPKGWQSLAQVMKAHAIDLDPAMAARTFSEMPDRSCLGSTGLGEIDVEGFGNAFGEAAAQVREFYWKRVDRSMADLGQRFLVLSEWRTPGEGAITECARLVRSAEVILPSFRNDAGLTTENACYECEGVAVIHALRDSAFDFDKKSLLQGPYAKGRPAFAWAALGPYSGPPPLSPDVVVVSPIELAAIFRKNASELAETMVPLVPAGSIWKYNDRGKDLGTAWRALDFDDADWPSGAAELGYGDAAEGRPEATTISFGDDPKKKRPCVYFRLRFSAKDRAALAKLSLAILCDDGCVAHLNGAVAARSNMPAGEVRYATFALQAVSGAEEHRFQSFAIDPRRLRDGENILAIEVHQSDATSSDLSFDAKLTGFLKKPPSGAKAGR